MADETNPTPVPESAPVVDNPVPDPSVPPENSQPTEVPAVPTVPDAAPAQDAEQLAKDFKKDELQAAAAVQGVDVPASATKADIAQAITDQSGTSQPVVVNNLTKRSDDDTILGGWLDIVSGEYSGRFGSYVATVTHDGSGYPENIIVRTRDADNLLLEVAYSDTRPSDRNGGR